METNEPDCSAGASCRRAVACPAYPLLHGEPADSVAYGEQSCKETSSPAPRTSALPLAPAAPGTANSTGQVRPHLCCAAGLRATKNCLWFSSRKDCSNGPFPAFLDYPLAPSTRFQSLHSQTPLYLLPINTSATLPASGTCRYLSLCAEDPPERVAVPQG